MTSQHAPAADTLVRREALVAALVELEQHVGASGWDQPPRLFALVDTDTLVATEPDLAAHLGLQASTETGIAGALTSIEQEHFDPGDDIAGALQQMMWPPNVTGCAVSLERSFLPAGSEDDIPADPEAAAAFVAGHPGRQDVRVVVGAVRPGPGHRVGVGEQRILSHGVARLVSRPDDLLGGAELVPGLAELVEHTLD